MPNLRALLSSFSLPARMSAIALLIGALVVIPGLYAEYSLITVREENERAGYATAALRQYLAMGTTSEEVVAQVRSGKVRDAASRQAVLDTLEAQIAQIDQATAAEMAVIAKGRFSADRAAQMQREEDGQKAGTDRLRAMKAQALTGRFDDAWWRQLRLGIASEESEVRGAQQRAVAALQRTQHAFFAISMVLVIGSIAIALWAGANIVTPLQRLLSSTRRISREDYGIDLPDEGPREFRALNRSFNAMAAQVGRSQARLVQVNRRLEDEVRARTAELMAANQSLRELDDRRRGFIATAGHELRTPVAVLRADAEVALREPAPTVPMLQASLERITRTAGTLGRLIEDMLRLARADAPVLSYERKAVDLADIVGETFDEFRPVIEADGGSITASPSVEPLPVRVDPLRIQQVVRIVLDNAVTHGGDELCICATLWREDGFACVRIADCGEGIAPERLAGLLDRSQWPRRRTEDGHGLGLTIAATIMEAHDGSIAIASRACVGAEVTLRLPCADPAAPQDDPRLSTSREARRGAVFGVGPEASAVLAREGQK
ncbi:sensor histidine kinase [Novosphingobium huizhouense]|uniref:sensor histidine kinase n=1 Tax=Novosphingobium huizhouense TaxID=2866625 RepID=UPI001CD86D11|nr:HAMP domain-containing sensor histidine kinase [Novosphingobium huizhouense]